MAKNNNLTDFLTDVADSIRTKKGIQEPINPQDFSSEIASIETGGGGGSSNVEVNPENPSQNLEIATILKVDDNEYVANENGLYDLAVISMQDFGTMTVADFKAAAYEFKGIYYAKIEADDN